MMEYTMLDGVDFSEKRYDMQDWMLSEKMYNCDGFSTRYYKEANAGAKSIFRLFEKKNS